MKTLRNSPMLSIGVMLVSLLFLTGVAGASGGKMADHDKELAMEKMEELKIEKVDIDLDELELDEVEELEELLGIEIDLDLKEADEHEK